MSKADATDDPAVGRHPVRRTAGASRPARARDERPARSRDGRPSGRRVTSPHANKFVLATSVLITIAIVVVATGYVIWHNDRGSTTSSSAWSTWHPRDSGNQGAVEIANHVAPNYRISGTQQLAAITVLNVADPSTIQNSATGTPPNEYQIALGNQPGNGSTTASVQLINGKTLAFNLCGLGNGCSIGAQIPSSQRELLLRREGLELALYAFHYLKNIDNVMAVLPPATIDSNSASSVNAKLPAQAGKKAATTEPLNLALMFQRRQLKPWTNSSTPLSSTLSALPPTVPELSLWSGTQEAALVSQLTAETLYTDTIEHLADGSSLIVLKPAPPQ